MALPDRSHSPGFPGETAAAKATFCVRRLSRIPPAGDIETVGIMGRHVPPAVA